MNRIGKVSTLLAAVAVLASPLGAAAPEASGAVRAASVKAIGTKLQASMVARLNKKVARRSNVLLAQAEGAAGAGAGAGGAGAGAGAAGAAGAGAAAGGLGVVGAVAGVAAAAGVATAASSGGNDSSP